MSTPKVIGSGASLAAPRVDQTKKHRRHVAQLYSTDEFLIKSLTQIMVRALRAGDSAIVVAQESHREALGRSLKGRRFNLAALRKQGRYVSVDASETLAKLMIDGRPDERLFAKVMVGLVERALAKSNGKSRRLTVFGEMVAVLWEQGNTQAALDLERLWNELGKKYSFALYCGYPIRGVDSAQEGELFLKVCDEHSEIMPGDTRFGPMAEEHRRRNIAHLQWRAQSLQNEIAERQQVERELTMARDQLEKRVMERTAELHEKNLQIQQQAESLTRVNRGLRQLSARLLRVQDEERRRIARELHDSTGQVLALLSMNLAGLEVEAAKVSPKLARSLSENARMVEQISGELRTISYLLHPPLLDEVGLESALRWYTEGFVQRSGIRVHLDLGGEFGRLTPDLETAVFRVVQECLTNIHRHSGSATAAIRLSQSAGRVMVEIEDAGKGIAPEKLSQVVSFGAPGVGLRGIRERIKDFEGELEIASGDNGTTVRVSIPISASSAAS